MITESEDSEKSDRARRGETPAQVIDQRDGSNENGDLDKSIRQRIQVKEAIKRQIVKSAPRQIKVERQIIKRVSRTRK